MMAVEERLAHVEGMVAGQGLLIGDLRAAVTSLEARVDRRFDQFETRLAQMDGRFTLIEGRLAALDQKLDSKIDALDQKLNARIDALDQKLEAKIGALDGKIDTKIDAFERKFDVRLQWMFGTMVALFGVVLAAVLTR